MSILINRLELTFKILLLLTSVTLGLLFLFAGAKIALAASLKTTTTIEEDVLRLGDIFDGLKTEDAAYILGPAPMPGEEMVIEAPTLHRIAVTLELPWRPRSVADKSVIQRAATLIDTFKLKEVLDERLRREGVSGKFNIIFSGKNPQIILPKNHDEQVVLSDLRFDHKYDQFKAVFVSPSIQSPVTQVTASGKIERLTTVPTLKSTFRSGEIIGKHDLEFIDITSRSLQQGTVIHPEDVIGMSPKRIIKPGETIHSRELQAPKLVSRRDMVTIVFSNGGMLLTAKGRALQNGAKGDIIRVVNGNSNRSIEAVVSGDKEVTVMP
jgi:flagella basal body P-ring formation protein FlgA